jgi:antirestriction protein ArdC
MLNDFNNFHKMSQLIMKKMGEIKFQERNKDCLPHNYLTNRRYNGINMLVLIYIADKKGYLSQRWLTKIQALKVNKEVIEGQFGTVLYFWRPAARTKHKTRSAPFKKLFVVYNLEQLRDIK